MYIFYKTKKLSSDYIFIGPCPKDPVAAHFVDIRSLQRSALHVRASGGLSLAQPDSVQGMSQNPTDLCDPERSCH